MAQVVLNWDITKASFLALCLDASVFLWYILSIEKGRQKMSLKGGREVGMSHRLFVLSAVAVLISGLCSLTLMVALMSTPAIRIPPEFNGVYTIHIGVFEDEKSAAQSIHGVNVAQRKAWIVKIGKDYHLILGEFKERREAENVLQSFLAEEQLVGAELLTPTRRWKLINL